MLVLSRKEGEEIVIQGGITIQVLKLKQGKVRLGIKVRPGTKVFRRELVLDGRAPDPDAAEEKGMVGSA